MLGVIVERQRAGGLCDDVCIFFIKEEDHSPARSDAQCSELHESGERLVRRGDRLVFHNSFQTVEVTELGFRVRVCQDGLVVRVELALAAAFDQFSLPSRFLSSFGSFVSFGLFMSSESF